jgi:putative transposase
MFALFHQLLHVLTSATRSHRDLGRQIQYLKVENEVLRGKLPGRVTVTVAERERLKKYAKAVGSAIRSLVTIVSPETVLRWLRDDKKITRTTKSRGRPRTPEQIRKLVLKLARENEWGYGRILGELKKLGITSLSKNTVKRILKAHGLEPTPKRSRDTWDEFLKRHAHSLWPCDFLTKKSLTVTGLRDVFVLVFIHVKSRQVVVSSATRTPNEAWVTGQIERFVKTARSRGLCMRTDAGPGHEVHREVPGEIETNCA